MTLRSKHHATLPIGDSVIMPAYQFKSLYRSISTLKILVHTKLNLEIRWYVKHKFILYQRPLAPLGPFESGSQLIQVPCTTCLWPRTDSTSRNKQDPWQTPLCLPIIVDWLYSSLRGRLVSFRNNQEGVCFPSHRVPVSTLFLAPDRFDPYPKIWENGLLQVLKWNSKRGLF